MKMAKRSKMLSPSDFRCSVSRPGRKNGHGAREDEEEGAKEGSEVQALKGEGEASLQRAEFNSTSATNSKQQAKAQHDSREFTRRLREGCKGRKEPAVSPSHSHLNVHKDTVKHKSHFNNKIRRGPQP